MLHHLNNLIYIIHLEMAICENIELHFEKG